MNEILEAALELLALGYHVIPIRGPKYSQGPDDFKKPLVEWKEFQREQPDHVQIRLWWEVQYPGANIAIVLGRGTCAIDIDGAAGHKELSGLGITSPDGAGIVSTGKPDGQHWYLRGEVPDRVGLLPGVDIRGVGYCVCPPSRHASGARYAWLSGPTHVDLLPAIPSVLLDVIKKDQGLYAKDSQPDWVARLLLEGSGEGSRNADGTRLAGYLFTVLPPDIAKACLLGWNDRNTPPLSRHEVETIAQSIGRRAAIQRVLPAVSQEDLNAKVSEASDARDVGSILLGLRPEEPRELIETPWDALNELLFGGITREEYLILGGRPSVGKTALALQYTRFVAGKGFRVLFVTLEMSARQLATRLAVLHSGLSAGALRRGGLSGQDLECFHQACREMQALPISIEGGLHSAEEIVAYVEQQVQRPDLIVLDYLQCLRPLVVGKYEDRRIEVDRSSQVLKTIPRRLNIPMLAISSLSRRDGEPTMHELKESGSLEYDADIIWLLHREKFERRIKVTQAKARDAEVGMFYLFYNGGTFTFSEHDPELNRLPVHNHGSEDGPGLACQERLIKGRLVGDCLKGSHTRGAAPERNKVSESKSSQGSESPYEEPF